MDRIRACGAFDVGSIPTEDTKMGLFFCVRKKADCFACA